MEVLRAIVDFILHVDVHLGGIIRHYGMWTYVVLFVIVFCETGLVILPLLPGDSLLFAAGAFAARGALNVWWLVGTLVLAAVMGDTVNYWIGYAIGPRVFSDRVPWLNHRYVQRAHQFYERYGGKTIVLARYMPIIRTFAPFVAGIGQMTYRRFLLYNFLGGVAWVGSLVGLGYCFSGLPVVRHHFMWVVVMIIVLSVLPPIVEFVRHRRRGVRRIIAQDGRS